MSKLAKDITDKDLICVENQEEFDTIISLFPIESRIKKNKLKEGIHCIRGFHNYSVKSWYLEQNYKEENIISYKDFINLNASHLLVKKENINNNYLLY